MSVEIRTVKTAWQRRAFVRLPFKLYRGNPFWVPPLIQDEQDTFNPKKNPAFHQAEARLFMAYRNRKPVGCVAAILSHIANEKYQTKNMRFGWFETVEDYEVAEALLKAVEEWARERGMETITGPHGFTDLDHQGMLVEGFDRLPTISVYYNPPYYPGFVERYGFEKEIDYVEFLSHFPVEEGYGPRVLALLDKIKKRGEVRLLDFKNMKEALTRAGELFDLINEAYAGIYGSTPLDEDQKRYYTKKYISFLDLQYLRVAVNRQNEMVGFFITMPSLSRGFQKARGRLLPFGWFHILRALKTRQETLDFYLVAVKPRYRFKGVMPLMVSDLVTTAMEKGFREGESSPMLETNTLVLGIHHYAPYKLHKRRRIYKKKVT
jgi:GNAT superfamily N-acetyltransferase